ncbi:MAG: hypothetical protein MR355_08400 [Lachnospiraceae bacterium]|nr:hypothetical protein [Lachnospiraceae bacterium]
MTTHKGDVELKKCKYVKVCVAMLLVVFSVIGCASDNDKVSEPPEDSEITQDSEKGQDDSFVSEETATFSYTYDLLSDSFECSTPDTLNMPDHLVTNYLTDTYEQVPVSLSFPLKYEDVISASNQHQDLLCAGNREYSEEEILDKYGEILCYKDLSIGEGLGLEVMNYSEEEQTVGECIENNWYFYDICDESVEEFATDKKNGNIPLLEDGMSYDVIGWFLNHWGNPTWIKVSTPNFCNERQIFMGYDTEEYTILFELQHDIDRTKKIDYINIEYIPSECRKAYFEHYDYMKMFNYEIEKGEITM